MLAVFLHRDVFRLPVIIFHRLVQIVGPGVFERKDIEVHGILAVDDAFSAESGFSFFTVEYKGFVSKSIICGRHVGRKNRGLTENACG